MNSGSVPCPACRRALPAVACNTLEPTSCPWCLGAIQVAVFPALFKPVSATRPAEVILEAGISSCFYHDQKKAVVACEVCGRFLCALCDVEFNEQHLCPNCLQSGQAKGRLLTLETQRVLWDGAALALSLLPLLIWPFTLLTAPGALACAIYSFFRPSSLVPRNRLRAYLAIVLSLAQIAGWILVFAGAGGWLVHATQLPGAAH